MARIVWRPQARSTRRAAVRAAPAVLPLSMWVTFTALTRRVRPVTAYNIGFAMYWGGWCLAFPIWVLGPRKAVQVLLAGRRPSLGEAVLLALPLAGSVGTQLVGNCT